LNTGYDATLARDYGRKKDLRVLSLSNLNNGTDKHQYDYDAATVIGFLNKYNLEKAFQAKY